MLKFYWVNKIELFKDFSNKWVNWTEYSWSALLKNTCIAYSFSHSLNKCLMSGYCVRDAMDGYKIGSELHTLFQDLTFQWDILWSHRNRDEIGIRNCLYILALSLNDYLTLGKSPVSSKCFSCCYFFLC